MSKNARSATWLCATIVFLLVACAAPASDVQPPTTPTATPAQEGEPTPIPEELPANAEAVQEDTAPAEENLAQPLPSEPQAITFLTSDGRTIEGVYYPGASNPSPIIV